jgi:hypothetical protein
MRELLKNGCFIGAADVDDGPYPDVLADADEFVFGAESPSPFISELIDTDVAAILCAHKKY